jgi:hypothetical protein
VVLTDLQNSQIIQVHFNLKTATYSNDALNGIAVYYLYDETQVCMKFKMALWKWRRKIARGDSY